MSIGQRIRRCRQAAGFTQKQLAEAVGLTESAIRNYELDIRTPKEAQIAAIAKTLGVAPASLEDLGVASARDVLEVIFRMEDELGLAPTENGDDIAIGLDYRAKGAQKAQMALKAWKSMRDDLDEGKVTQEEYEAWKASFGA